MMTPTSFPKCAACNQEVRHFADWFSDDCPARIHLPPEQGGHQLTVG